RVGRPAIRPARRTRLHRRDRSSLDERLAESPRLARATASRAGGARRRVTEAPEVHSGEPRDANGLSDHSCGCPRRAARLEATVKYATTLGRETTESTRSWPDGT